MPLDEHAVLNNSQGEANLNIDLIDTPVVLTCNSQQWTLTADRAHADAKNKRRSRCRLVQHSLVPPVAPCIDRLKYA